MKDELEDFESFLDPNFNKYKFTNDLLLGTNDHDCTNLDIETSIKKLTFDLDEVETRMTKLSSNNYEDLIGNFQNIETTNRAMKSKIGPSIARVNNSFNKINEEIIKPFDQSQNINQAIRKVHITLDLLRSSNFLFLILSQIDDLENEDDDKRKSNDIIKLCRMYNQVNILLDKESIDKNAIDHTVSLTSLKIIREYQPVHNMKYNQLVDTIITTLNTEINHSSKFQVSNITLRNYLIGYYMLKPNDLLGLLDRISISKQMQLSLNQLSRSLQSPRNFNQMLKEVHQESTDYLTKLAKILNHCEVYREDGATTLYDIIQDQDLNHYYWNQLLTSFEKVLVSTMLRGGPIAKNLKTYYVGIQNSIREIFQGEELVMMLKVIEVIHRR